MPGAGYDISLSAATSSGAHNASPFSVTDNSGGGSTITILIVGLVLTGLLGLVIWFKKKGGK